jgi:hypothetical protein
MDIQTQYTERAKKYFANTYQPIIGSESDDETNHIINIASSIMLTRDGVLNGGSFVQAIIDNDLEEAIGRADSTCIKALKFFVQVKLYCHI